MLFKLGTLTLDPSTGQAVESNVTIVDLAQVQSPDPLAYAYGVFQQKQGKPMPKRGDKGFRKLAPEFIRGYIDSLTNDPNFLPPGLSRPKSHNCNKA